jgi:hypothetical protein
MVDNLKIVEIVNSGKVIEIIKIKPRSILEKLGYLIKRLAADNNSHFVSGSNGTRNHLSYLLGYLFTI